MVGAIWAKSTQADEIALVDRIPTTVAVTSPLVSVIIVNYNNNAFLTKAFESVLAQTYQNIEIIIVDDASSDGSQKLIKDIKGRHDDVRIILRPMNGGQSAASSDGLAAAMGSFVYFLDSDDFIDQSFLDVHVSVHLRLRASVGFTCCDMIQVVDGLMVAASDSNVSRHLKSEDIKLAPMRPPADLAAAGHNVSSPVPDELVTQVDPWQIGWPWSATSAIVFRRSALLMFADATKLNDIRRSMDAFYCRGINAVSGSAIIDLPLAFYRLHTTNLHLKREPLNNTISFDRGNAFEINARVVDALLEHIIQNFDRFEQMFWEKVGYIRLLKNIIRQYPPSRKISGEILITSYRLYRRIGIRRLLRQVL